MSETRINSDVNILGGLPTWELVEIEINNRWAKPERPARKTHIKTEKSVDRYQSAIQKTLLSFSTHNLEALYESHLTSRGVDDETLIMLFWNGSYNNDLLRLINQNVLFPALFSGRSSIAHEEIFSYLNDLKITNEALKSWGVSTVKTTASKYLTLLTKFGLLSGTYKRAIEHRFFSDALFIAFVYWLCEVEHDSNLLNSEWLAYSLSEKQPFIDRLTQTRFRKYYQLTYTATRLTIAPSFNYSELFHELSKPINTD